MRDIFLSNTPTAAELNAQIRTLRREVADMDNRKITIATARDARAKKLARLESQLAMISQPGQARTAMACS